MALFVFIILPLCFLYTCQILCNTLMLILSVFIHLYTYSFFPSKKMIQCALCINSASIAGKVCCLHFNTSEFICTSVLADCSWWLSFWRTHKTKRTLSQLPTVSHLFHETRCLTGELVQTRHYSQTECAPGFVLCWQLNYILQCLYFKPSGKAKVG